MCYQGRLSLRVTGAGRLSILSLHKQPCLVAQDSWLPYRAKFIPSHPRINNASSQRMKNNCHHQGQQIFLLQLWDNVSTYLSCSFCLFAFSFFFLRRKHCLRNVLATFLGVLAPCPSVTFLNAVICGSHCISLCNIWVMLAAICFYLPQISCGRPSAAQAECGQMKCGK